MKRAAIDEWTEPLDRRSRRMEGWRWRWRQKIRMDKKVN